MPGIDFNHFKGKGSEAVIKMVEPQDTTILQGQEEKSSVRVVAWTDGEKEPHSGGRLTALTECAAPLGDGQQKCGPH